MSQVVTQVFQFTVILSGIDELTVETGDALFEAGCDDASPQSNGPVVFLEFDREASSLAEAVGSAIRDVERAGFHVARIVVESEHVSN